jgi:hypothetical protein
MLLTRSFLILHYGSANRALRVWTGKHPHLSTLFEDDHIAASLMVTVKDPWYQAHYTTQYCLISNIFAI